MEALLVFALLVLASILVLYAVIRAAVRDGMLDARARLDAYEQRTRSGRAVDEPR